MNKVKVYEAVKAGHVTSKQIVAATGIAPGSVGSSLHILVRDGSLKVVAPMVRDGARVVTPPQYGVVDG